MLAHPLCCKEKTAEGTRRRWYAVCVKSGSEGEHSCLPKGMWPAWPWGLRLDSEGQDATAHRPSHTSHLFRERPWAKMVFTLLKGKKKIKRLFHDIINDMLLWRQCPHIKFSWNTAKPVHLWTVCSGFRHRDLISPWSLKYLFSGPWQSVPAPDRSY